MIVLITRFFCLILLGAAISQKSYQLDNSLPEADGSANFLMGFIGVFYGGAALCWLANPICLISLLMMRSQPIFALIASVLALSFALAFLLFDQVVATEAPTYAKIIGYRVGYWLWVSSMTTLLIGNLLSFLTKLK